MENYIPVPPLLIIHGSNRSFETYIKNKNSDNYILYSKDEKLSERHKQLLYQNDVDTLYIKTEDTLTYKDYIEHNYGPILMDESIPIDERSKIFYNHNISLIQNIFTHSLPKEILVENTLKELMNIIKSNYEFITSNISAFKSLGSLISHDYKTYSHCVNVMVYTLVLLSTLDLSKKTVYDVGIGAFLHDIGKIQVPHNILTKPSRLTDSEFNVIKKHPVQGLELAKAMNLSQISCNCILFHHEKLDGTGYPTNSEDLPIYVRVVTLADIYDALSTERPYCKAYTPFESLKIMMKDVEKGKLDKNLYQTFVKILSGSKLIS